MTTLERRRNWKISVYGREHGAPYAHVTSPDFRATVAIADGQMLAGSAPEQMLAGVRTWLQSHRSDALAQWQQLNPSHRG